MFHLYDQTRRRISIALFVLLALVPTAAVLACALWLNTDAHVQSEAAHLGRQLGLSVTVKAIRHLTPSKTIYEGVQLADPETGRAIFSCSQLEALWRSETDDAGNPQPSLLLSATEAQLDADHSQQAWLALQRFLTRQTVSADIDLQFSAASLALQAPAGPHALQDVQIRFRSAPSETWADLHFRLAQTDMPDPVRLCAWRDRKSTPPGTGLLLDTGRSTIPCSLLPSCLAVSDLFGPQSLAQIYLQASQTEQGWTGQAKAQLWRVDLDRLVTGRLPHTLHGLGQIAIDSAQFSQGRLTQLQGNLQAPGGQLSASFLDAASQWLNLQKTGDAGPAPPDARSLVTYSDLAVGFLIDDHGLQIWGRTPTAPILSGPQGPLLSQTAASQQPMPVASLLNTLFPMARVQVPASHQAQSLLSRLPCPVPADSEPQVATKPSTDSIRR